MTAAEPVVCLRGERVALGPLRHDLLDTFMRWGNDLPTSRNLGAWGAATAESNAAWLARHDDPADTSLCEFLIYELATWRPLGVVALHHVDARNRAGEFATVIAERDARGQGYGTEAARLLLGYGFETLALHNILLRYYAFNPASGRLARRLGFREIGRQTGALVIAGQRWDMHYMELLDRDFAAGATTDAAAPG